jgi:formylglycine-generating enzyme required for sulfatase activity
MYEDSESIAALQRLLVVHRRTIEFLEMQRAYFGAFTPPYIWHQFDEARSEIERVKKELRASGQTVEDLPGDAPPEQKLDTAQPADDTENLVLTYQHMLIEQTRYLSRFSSSPWGELYLQLSRVYAERRLLPLHAINQPSIIAHDPTEALFNLIQVPGARILLEGEAGSGKTTCLHMLALACAAYGTGEAQEAAEYVRDWPKPVPLPILLSAREIAMALEQGEALPDGMQQPGPSVFWQSIERWLEYSDLGALLPTIQQRLERGECLVLIDDLDDFPPKPQRAYAVALGRFISRYPHNRYLLTWRARDTGMLAGVPSFVRYRLSPLEGAQIDGAVAKWYNALSDWVSVLLPDVLEQRIRQLQGLINGDHRLQEIARTGRGLWLLLLAHAQGLDLPAERAQVIHRDAIEMFASWDQVSGGVKRQPTQLEDVGKTRLLNPDRLGDPSISTERWLEHLELLAFAFQERLEQGHDVPKPMSYNDMQTLLSESRALASIERRRRSQDLIQWCCRCGILSLDNQGNYTMPMRLLREYLAARALGHMDDFAARVYVLSDHKHWHEPILQAIQAQRQRRDVRGAISLIQSMIDSYRAEDTRTYDRMLFAAECILELGDQAPRDVRTQVYRSLAEIFKKSSVATAQRVAAGLLIGRLDITPANPLSPTMVLVQGGPFLLGTDLIGTQKAYPDEGPQQMVNLATFSIGKYPVTNREYQSFLDERPDWPRPRYWNDLRFNNPVCPVVGITWYDAMEYCAWLQKRLQQAGRLLPNQAVRLPSEWEWEKAASWDAHKQRKYIYPWGNVWEDNRANIDSDSSRKDGKNVSWYTSPVGSYPSGMSVYGMHDAIGNVWEWMLDQYASYPKSEKTFVEEGRYTLRGSSCASHPTHARTTYRSRLPPNAWRYHLGFRIVIGPKNPVPDKLVPAPKPTDKPQS